MEKNDEKQRVIEAICRSDDMAPTIEIGDKIYIDTTRQEIECDGLYALSPSGITVTKRLITEPGARIRVVSDSANKTLYPDQIYMADEMNLLNIVGRVVGWRKAGFTFPGD